MRAPRFETAIACAVLALSVLLAPVAALGQQADAGAAKAVDGVPVPDVTPLPPPTAADFGVKVAPKGAAATEPAAAATRSVDVTPANAPTLSEQEIERAIPMPEEAGVAPPTLKDIGPVPPAPVDVAVSDKLKDLITTAKLDHFVGAKRERTAVETFYKERHYAPIWIADGAATPRMGEAIARLKAADADGLDASSYPTPDLETLSHDPDALAEAELRLTGSALTYARQAEGGRVTPSRISPNIDFNPPTPDPAQVLKTLADAKDIAAALGDYNPQHAGFRALKAKLAELRGKGPAETEVTIPPGRLLRPGMSDPRVPALRERLSVSGDPTSTEYDRDLAEAVKAFQRSKGQRPDGVLGNHTVAALNGRSHSHDADIVISNMERWRWLPRDLGSSYVMVNVPDFTLKVVHDHKTVFHTRIVAGKPGTPSPSFSAAIENILVNPSWHVPQSIIYKEYLPALQQDPTVLTRMGLTLKHERDGTISITQPPSERNALGRIKFNFPNKYQVYLHDTPDKRLFAQERRAFSHGCMRVQNPTQFGEVLLSLAEPPELRYSAERLQHMFGSEEHWLNFKRKIPVHLVYLNAYVDDAGKLVIRDDLYGYDARVRSALRGEYMAVAERSQKVTPGAAQHYNGPVRQAVRDQGYQYQSRGGGGFFGFPWFQ
jgi:murein L,D-transpeptidase YcbB/YkuD